MRLGSLSLLQSASSSSQSFPFPFHAKQLFLLIIPASSNYQQYMPQATLITEISRTLRNQLGGPLCLLICLVLQVGLSATPHAPPTTPLLCSRQSPVAAFSSPLMVWENEGSVNLDPCKLHVTMVSGEASEPQQNRKLPWSTLRIGFWAQC